MNASRRLQQVLSHLQQVGLAVKACAVSDISSSILGSGTSSPSSSSKQAFSSSFEPLPPNLVLRALEPGDFDKGFLPLLGQLAQVGEITREQFESRFLEMADAPGHYFIMVIEDTTHRLIVAAATLVIERKFIHACGKVGHVEDVVVNKTYRGKNLGLRVVDALVQLSQRHQCYKVILDCSDANVPFYSRLQFVPKERQMARYLNQT